MHLCRKLIIMCLSKRVKVSFHCLKVNEKFRLVSYYFRKSTSDEQRYPASTNQIMLRSLGKLTMYYSPVGSHGYEQHEGSNDLISAVLLQELEHKSNLKVQS